MWCNDCGEVDNVQSVPIVDLDSDIPEMHARDFCQRCLEEKGLWCEVHGARLLLHDPSVAADAEYLMVMSVCEACVEMRLRMMSDTTVATYTEMIKRLLSENLVQVLSLGSALTRMDGDPDRAALYRLMVTAEMYNSTIEQTIQDLATRNLAIA